MDSRLIYHFVFGFRNGLFAGIKRAIYLLISSYYIKQKRFNGSVNLALISFDRDDVRSDHMTMFQRYLEIAESDLIVVARSISVRALITIPYRLISAKKFWRSIVCIDNYERLFVFCDLVPFQSYFAQLQSSRGLKSYSFQHGYYRYPSNYIDKLMFNIASASVSYCWDSRTYDILARFGNNGTLVKSGKIDAVVLNNLIIEEVPDKFIVHFGGKEQFDEINWCNDVKNELELLGYSVKATYHPNWKKKSDFIGVPQDYTHIVLNSQIWERYINMANVFIVNRIYYSGVSAKDFVREGVINQWQMSELDYEECMPYNFEKNNELIYKSYVV